ncbi:MAG: fused MFS/spermidine synthase [Bdellovibrionales bacterium]
MTKTWLLFLVILVEGYVVLAVELLAIRQLLPFAGSGVEVVAIVISGVLLPLAIGYHYGGTAYRRVSRRRKRWLSVRRLLLGNLVLSLLVLTFGLSYPILEDFFRTLETYGVTHRLSQTAIYTFVFLVGPVFLLGQTVPLVSHYFSRRRLSEITGRMLFFSTLGAFLGSVFSTLVLMMTIGVHNTVIVTLGLLALLCLLLSRKKRRAGAWAGGFLFFLVFALNNDPFMKTLGIVSDNAYNLAQTSATPEGDIRTLFLNRSISSQISSDLQHTADYLKFIEQNFIATLPPGAPHDILVIGAGGFTVGLRDKINNYTFVDIDPDMKNIAERHFLPEPLGPNKIFVTSSARAFVRRDEKKYDLIVIDVFQNTIAIPAECTTREFLQDTKARLKEGGALVVNVIASPYFQDKFSVRYDRTFGDVFPVHNRQIIGDFNPWRADETPGPPPQANIIYSYFNRETARDNTVYTDDKNTFSIDRP